MIVAQEHDSCTWSTCPNTWNRHRTWVLEPMARRMIITCHAYAVLRAYMPYLRAYSALVDRAGDGTTNPCAAMLSPLKPEIRRVVLCLTRGLFVAIHFP